MKITNIIVTGLLLAGILGVNSNAFSIEPLVVKGANYYLANPKNDEEARTPVRFWGVNSVSVYPTETEAVHIAKRLAYLGVNLVRHHHMPRGMLRYGSGTTATSFNEEGLKSFINFNRVLSENGIYYNFPITNSRSYSGADRYHAIFEGFSDELLGVSAGDWETEINKIRGLDWQMAMNIHKRLPLFDIRSAMLCEDYIRTLLTQWVVPGKYQVKDDPALISIEVSNEGSLEYALKSDQIGTGSKRFSDDICPVLRASLTQQWQTYLVSHEGFSPSQAQEADLYGSNAPSAQRTRFCGYLEERFYERIRKVVQDELGCKKPIIYDNLWRGEEFAKTDRRLSAVIEEHSYQDPFIADKMVDLFDETTYRAPDNKPYFIGEINQAFWGRELKETYQVSRSMLPFALATYGLFNNWSGVEFFAWMTGKQFLKPDTGLATDEHWRLYGGGMSNWSVLERIGFNLFRDGMFIDHLRTASTIFRNNYLSASKEPKTIIVSEEETFITGHSYAELTTPKYKVQPGWQSVHAIKKVYGTEPPNQKEKLDVLSDPAPVVNGRLITDTKEIVKDLNRQQVSFATEYAEGFSGMLDDEKPEKLNMMRIGDKKGFATVMLVSNDKKKLVDSKNLLLSKTILTGITLHHRNPEGSDESKISHSKIDIMNLADPPTGGTWLFIKTRPEGDMVERRLEKIQGVLSLPTDIAWDECELKMAIAPIKVENDFLQLGFSDINETFTVYDKRTGKKWEQESLGDWKVRSCEKLTDGAMLHLTSISTDTNVTATITLEANSPEVLVRFSGSGQMPARTPGYPAPFITQKEQRILAPLNEGIGVPVDEVDPVWNNATYPFYVGHWVSMSFVGLSDYKTGQGVLTILETPDDAILRFRRSNNGLLQSQVAWVPQTKNYGYPRVLRFVFFDKGGHVAVTKRYRAYVKEQGLVVTFREKQQQNPKRAENLSKLLGAANIWYWNQRDSKEMLLELHNTGFDQMLWSNCRSPEVARLALNLPKVLTSRYDIYNDVMDPAARGKVRWHEDWVNDAWPDEVVWDDPAGTLAKGWGVQVIGEERGVFIYCTKLCDVFGPKYAREKISKELDSIPFTARFLDVTTAGNWNECYHPAHPLTRSESKVWRMKTLDLIGKEFDLVCGSESGHESAVPYCDYFEGMMSLSSFRVPESGRYMQEIWQEAPDNVAKYQTGEKYRLPLWELVYHDCCVATWYWGDYNNKVTNIWDKRDLFNALYGTPPMYMFSLDYWNDNKSRFLTSYRTAQPVSALTASEEMIDHRFLSEDMTVQQSVFANGVTVTVNFGEKSFTMADDFMLESLKCRIEKPNRLQ